MASEVVLVEEFEGYVTVHESYRGYLAKVLVAFKIEECYQIITDNEVPEEYYRIHGEDISGFFVERKFPDNRELKKIARWAEAQS